MTAGTADWVGQLIDHRYQVSKKLGEGGMGFVYTATDNRLSCKVVLKVPRFEMLADPEFRQRFVDEVRALVNLSHPHIVKVTDFGTHHGTPFAVMQFLPGGSLEDRRPRTDDHKPKAVSANSLSTWLPAVADALDYIHSQRYIHRDIKPGNILFDAQKHAFISDFGVAKAAGEGTKRSSNLTGVGNIIGTPEYLAPEVVLGQTFDGRIDQYALAVTVYELLAGRVPFQGNAPTATLVMHTRDVATPLDQLRPSVPRALAAAIERGMAKTPAERFPTCTAFAQACIAALGTPASGVPLHANPTPPRASTVRETLGSVQAGLGTPLNTPMTAGVKQSRSSLGLILGLASGALVLIGVAAAIAVVAMKGRDSADPPPTIAKKADQAIEKPLVELKNKLATIKGSPPLPPSPALVVTNLRTVPTSLTLLAGRKAQSIEIFPTRPNGEPVTLTVDGPPEVVVTPPSAALLAGERSIRFEIAAAAGTPPASRTVTVSAKTASQVTATITSVSVTILAPSFSMPNLADRTVQAGAMEHVEVTVNRAGGYDGVIDLSVDSSKVVEAARATVPAGETRGTIKIAVRDSAPGGVEVVTVKAEPTSPGIAPASVGIKVRVASFRKLGEFSGHDGAVSALAFDPTGQRMLVGTTTGWVYCWDFNRPEKWSWAEVKHAGWVTSLAFSPDGTQGLSGGDDNVVYLLKATSGAVEAKLHNNEHASGVSRVWFARQGSPVPIVDPKQQVKTAPADLPVSASPNRTVYWDTKSGKPLLCFWKTDRFANNTKTGMRFLNESGGIQPGPAAYHEFGNSLALAGLGGDKLEVYQNKQLRASATGNGVIHAFAVNADGTRVLTACADGQFRLWEIAGRTAKPAPGFPWKPDATATEVALAPDGSKMIFGGPDGNVRLYKLP